MISPKQMIPPKLLLVITLFMGLMVTCEGPVLQCTNKIIEGEDGDTVILPCSTKDKMDISLEQVEWFFEDPTTGKYETVHAYFQHKDYLQEQRDDFINRTSLFKEELSSGNCSLSLKGTTSHSGRYFCSVPGYQSCNVTLKVHPKGKNNTSQNLQEGTASPDNPNNDTDGQTNYGAIGGVLVIVAAVLGIIAFVLHLYSGRKPKTSQTYQEVSDQAQQLPLKIKNPWTQMNRSR